MVVWASWAEMVGCTVEKIMEDMLIDEGHGGGHSQEHGSKYKRTKALDRICDGATSDTAV
jgi:hypothetical protein